jgi:ABC-type cobalamin/Fe3+-siderophores transport system ATPase subunit
MPLELREILSKNGDLVLELNLALQDGMFIVLAGPNGSGKKQLLEIAGGLRKPDQGEIISSGRVELAHCSLDSADVRKIRQSIDNALEQYPDVLLIGPGFALTDPEYKAKTLAAICAARQHGTLTLLVSHDLTLPLRYCDEVVLMERGHIIDRGDPKTVLKSYQEEIHTSRRIISRPSQMKPSSRHGDGRAEIKDIQVINSAGDSVGLIRNGETMSVRVHIHYLEDIANPIIGMLIRSRVGVNVYGTNTELENILIGPCKSGDEVELHFHFTATLCPQDYTLTVASHDLDGTAHEWLENAVSFTISDTRHTEGVADLKAKITVRRLDAS